MWCAARVYFRALTCYDIANVSSLLRFVLFADDTNIVLSGDDAKEISNTLYIELDKLNSWFAVNKLSLNVSKTN